MTAARLRRMAVYPRVGGGNECAAGRATKIEGLSPRGRGKLRPHDGFHNREWSIPAWAGETTKPNPFMGWREVYPRVGGGNLGLRVEIGRSEGLSPRGRGKPERPVVQVDFLRSIPAWAGETRFPQWRNRRSRVYPRVGGGNVV